MRNYFNIFFTSIIFCGAVSATSYTLIKPMADCEIDKSCSLNKHLYAKLDNYFIVPEKQIIGNTEQALVINIGENASSLTPYAVMLDRDISKDVKLKDIKCNSHDAMCYILYSSNKNSAVIAINITSLRNSSGSDYQASVLPFKQSYISIELLADHSYEYSPSPAKILPFKLH
ncbi:hypothetical protein [Aquella oligotrophica]|uniref:Uncharacterized protein n=1 Tax=Aquella oligotrophica TaxID=2067065 RepID=A0A2I7N8K0_9NEIS|nr:hypothetical protein [Aquella oligotrophica]AUR52787.1 hypothetical protein CUN60_10950 [Aquella oligotrophica]